MSDTTEKLPLTTPVSFNATIWKQGEIFIIRVDKSLAKKYQLEKLDVRVIIDPMTYVMEQKLVVTEDSPPEKEVQPQNQAD